MGNCGSGLDFTATDQPVEGNPDVAGIGVRHHRSQLKSWSVLTQS